MKRIAGILASWTALALGAAAQAQNDDSVPRIEWRDCPWTQTEAHPARCGNLVVLQSRAAPDGPRIRMFFAIYPPAPPAGSAPESGAPTEARPDPIVVVPGGPGALFNPPVAYVMNGLAALRRTREIIIVDQRGVGRSEPRIACAEQGGRRRASIECLDDLKARGIDPRAFNTEETTRDIADLRRALGRASWNAIGASYGSRVVLRLAQIDPAGTRSVVSIASLPLRPSLSRNENVELRRALLDRLFADCAAEPACDTAYGNLAFKLARIRVVLRERARTPITAQTSDTLRHLAELERRTGGIERALIARLDWAEELPKLPRVVAELDEFLRGTRPLDRTHLDAIYGVGAHRPMPPIDNTMILVTTRCPEDVLPEERTPRRGRVEMRDACSFFTAAPVADMPAAVTPPVLILTGAYDIRTLSIWSDEIAARFPGSVVARMGDAGHDVSYRHPCGNAVMNAFVADPKARPDLGCVAAHARPKFEVPEPVR